jgi:hypothetical protein
LRKALIVLTMIAAHYCALFLCRDITHSLRAAAQARQSFVAAVDADNDGDNTVTFSTGGWNNDVLVVHINADQVERDAIAAEILYGSEDVRDSNFREHLKMLGFKRIQIGELAPQPIQTGGGDDRMLDVATESKFKTERITT